MIKLFDLLIELGYKILANWIPLLISMVFTLVIFCFVVIKYGEPYLINRYNTQQNQQKALAMGTKLDKLNIELAHYSNPCNKNAIALYRSSRFVISELKAVAEFTETPQTFANVINNDETSALNMRIRQCPNI